MRSPTRAGRPARRPASAATVALVAVLAAAGCGGSSRSSTSGSGQQAAGESGSPSVSADGAKVAFQSAAANLVTGDTNGAVDIFVRADADPSTIRVSVGTGGAQADGPSSRPAISADGRFVAFVSEATNLVSGDTNGKADVFVRDTQAGTTTRVSVGAGGAQADGPSSRPAISSDGRYVAFVSDATNLVAGDTNGVADAFVRDTQAGTTTRVSVGAGGAQADAETRDGPAISADGRYVAFVSQASNLVAGDTNDAADAFVRDTQAGTTVRASLGPSNEQGATEAQGETYPGIAISGDGRYVAFVSDATNLVNPAPPGLFTNVYRRDLQAATTVLVSVTPSGTMGDADSRFPTMSADGRYVGFESDATNLVANDTNGVTDVFLRDLVGGPLDRVSVTSNGSTEGNGPSTRPAIAAGGNHGAFETLADNLPSSSPDTNSTWDVVSRRR